VSEQENKEKILQLEKDLAKKDLEILNYKKDLLVLNHKIESLVTQMQGQLQWAQTIQKLLSPTELPAIPGFEFSTKFIPGLRGGGDYFDIFEHEDKFRFGIFISSCSGYSISSLLLSLVIKISAQIESRKGMSPELVIQKLGHDLAAQVQNQEKASVFYGVIDRRNFEMKYCLVGSIDVFLQTFGQESPQRISSCGEPLSKDFSFLPTLETLQMKSKDRLILATEGLKNSQDKSQCYWGSLGLEQSILKAPRQGVHELRNEIFYQNEKFSGKTEPDRDQTVIIGQVKENLIMLAKN
jgi:sigma-B regulation protein RsbU (phosphoserine phosphatase)